MEISKPAMEWETLDLRELLACLRRELAFRERCYPKWVAQGTLKQEKADKELLLMRQCVEFMTHCIFKAVVARRELTVSRERLRT